MKRWMSALAILIFAYVASTVRAEAPTWVGRPQVEDSDNRYYVGRATGRSSDPEQSLFEQATLDARNTAIAEQFGVLTGIEKQSYQSLETATSVQRLSETSKRVVIRGFQRVDQFINDDGTRKSVWLFFRYPKSEIAAEMRRLRAQASETPVEFSDVSATPRGGGFLELMTSPHGASLTIDGQSYGLTPVRVRLDQGSHSIFVDHPLFNHLNEEVVIQEGKATRLNKVMTRSDRKVVIRTNPSGASVMLGGKYLGLSPVETEVVAGERQTLLVEHPEAQPYSSVVEVGKGDAPYVVSVPDLILRPSFLSVNSVPQGADVFIDGSVLGKTPTGFRQVSSGVLNIKVEKEGYIVHEEEVALRGGEKRPLQTSLKPFSEIEKEKNIERIRIERAPYILSAGLSYHSTTHVFRSNQGSPSVAGLNLSFEKKFWNLIGLRVQYEILSGKDDEMETNTQSVRESTGNQIAGAVPIYLFGGLYLGPVVSKTSMEIKCKYGGSTCTGYSVSQTSSGAIIGWQYFWKNDLGIDVSYDVQKYSSGSAYDGVTGGTLRAMLSGRF